MNHILIIGSGARECIIVKKLISDSDNNIKITCMGINLNPYLNNHTNLILVDELNIDNLKKIINTLIIDYAIIGPENPLELGFVDYLENINIHCIGPLKEYAQLETSKSYCRNFLKNNNLSQYSPKNIEINNYQTINKLTILLKSFNKIVIKRDGLCNGKGVIVQDMDFLSKEKGIEHIISHCNNNKILIEEKLEGEEYSLMSITDGYGNIAHFPPIQDYKRLMDNDEGPNTGGMGCVIDKNNKLPFLTVDDISESKYINEKIINNIKNKDKIGYRGILYGSYIKCNDGLIKIIEFNCRFGDPECIIALTLLKTNFYDLCNSIIYGKMITNLVFDQNAMICIYMVPTNYPYNKSDKYDIYISNENNIIYSNIEQSDNHLYSLSSRTLLYIEKNNTLYDCFKNIYNKIKNIHGNLYYRKDIGLKFI